MTNAGNRGPAGHARVFLRPIANPLILGYAGLAAATLVTSGFELGWIASSERTQVGLLVLLFAPLLQLVASVFGFLARDPVAATGMGILSGAWLALGVVYTTTPARSQSDALGTFLLPVAAALLLVAVTAGISKLLPALVTMTAAVRLAMAGIYELSGLEAWQNAAGVVGLVLCGVALYAVAALGWEDQLRQTVLPTLRRGTGREVLEAPFDDQVREASREAGVRARL